jgi:hypothetical protein
MIRIKNLTRKLVRGVVSPAATRVFSSVFINRHSIEWGIRAISEKLDEKERVSLKMALVKFGIIQAGYRGLELKQLKHHHLAKCATSSKLLLAANDFYRTTGRDDFLKVIPGIVSGKTQGEVDFGPSEAIDYYKILIQTIRPRILKELNPKELDEDSAESKVIRQAFEFASKLSTSQASLIYRIKKMSDIGGDLLSIVSCLFMDIEAEDLPKLFEKIDRESDLFELRDSICSFVKAFQLLKKDFQFDFNELPENDEYIQQKMSEVIRISQFPQTMLVFFLFKLREAREARDKTEKIFNEIRFLCAPLAERMGLVFLADDFRDQWLRLKDPEKYAQIESLVKERIGMDYESAKIFLSIYAKDVISLLEEKLGEKAKELSLKYRAKSPYSIWNKVEVRKEYNYGQLKDFLGIKIVCRSSDRAVLKSIQNALRKSDIFNEIPKETAEALKWHRGGWMGIKMLGQEREGKPLEIQIMTAEMNRENNRGKAATWLYNLKKDLGEMDQTFKKLEPKLAVSSNFFVDFYVILKNGTIPFDHGH